ncbi:hypothetical protein ONE63_005200 [Megalurothrips usitatus]|uniref:Uncharacterized protein n=1 Tax=Megalurothrips usitatus TaxID=439358 RepID=A0AAV7Y0W9_9NEOP|nr:hypothetical protein ONE63_005200 [Megalurothrips usitatus]
MGAGSVCFPGEGEPSVDPSLAPAAAELGAEQPVPAAGEAVVLGPADHAAFDPFADEADPFFEEVVPSSEEVALAECWESYESSLGEDQMLCSEGLVYFERELRWRLEFEELLVRMEGVEESLMSLTAVGGVGPATEK